MPDVFDLYDLYTVEMDTPNGPEQLLVFSIDTNQIDSDDAIETTPVAVTVTIDPVTGDRIIRIPGEYWEYIPVETATEFELGEEFSESDEDDDGSETIILNGEYFGSD